MCRQSCFRHSVVKDERCHTLKEHFCKKEGTNLEGLREFPLTLDRKLVRYQYLNLVVLQFDHIGKFGKIFPYGPFST